MAQGKLLKFTVLGAIIGAAVSMLDRNTREYTVAKTKKVTETISYYAKNRDELQSIIGEKTLTAQSLYENVSENVNRILSVKEELKDLPHTIKEMVGDAKVAAGVQEDEL